MTDINKYKFLIHKYAKEVFAETDNWLKSGFHIQKNHPEQSVHFGFIKDNKEYLENFYEDFYQVKLEEGTDNSEKKYYYLEFIKDKGNNLKRGKIGMFKPEYLLVEFVVVGLFLKHITNLDFVDSISGLQKMLHHDYDEYKDGFYRLFANVSDKKFLPSDEKLVNDKIEKAIKKFAEIGWLYLMPDNDKFKIMPSFHRFTNDLYFEAINRAEELFKTTKTQ